MKLPMKSEKNGIALTVYEVNRGTHFNCGNCWQKESCDLKLKCMGNSAANSLDVLEIVIGVLNATDTTISINTGLWELIDSEGFACGAFAPCERFQRIRFVNCSHWTVSPGTQVKAQLLFPEMESSLKPISLIFADRTNYIRLDFSKPSKALLKLFAPREETVIQNKIAQDYELRQILANVKTLKVRVFSRFNNILSEKEISALDNEIANLLFSIGEYTRKADSWKKELFCDDYLAAKHEYEERIKQFRAKEQKKSELTLKVDQLQSLQPREFEEWTQSLFVALGYDNVILTPTSGDKGIDIRAEKAGKRIAVQCKKYKGVIGTPILQGFLGAMQTEGFDKGFIITTGTFSVGAEKMVESTPVELYDKIRLRELIEEALKNK